MREIKFRAWDKKAKCWVDDYFDDTHVYTLSFSGNIVYDLKPHKSKTPESMGWVLVGYTGIKDKNGVEIYEGDIGEYGKINGIPFYAKVIFHNELARYMFEFDEGHGVEYSELCDYDGSMPADWFEVIGNIYENKELLGEQHENDH